MYQLIHGDCLEKMKNIESGTVDMILADLPYGITGCKWDVIIPFDPLWEQYWRILKQDGVCLLFGTEPFSSLLRSSQIMFFKYDWIWKKNTPSGHLWAKKKPLKYTENISVFFKKSSRYYPQNLIKINKVCSVPDNNYGNAFNSKGKKRLSAIQEFTNYPKNILKFNSEKGLHTSQKPVPLLEYLIKTYTNECDIVLDNVMGSGSTGVACINTGRKFIGIENDEKYFEIAKDRIMNAIPPSL